MRIIEQLRAGQRVFTLGLRNARHADIVRMARSAGYQAIWIDLEHSSMSVDVAAQIAASAADLGIEAWVRVPERDYGVIGRLLDGGADGIIAPCVESVAQAQEVVRACRFPPRGRRSQIARLPQVGFTRLPAPDLNAIIDGRTTVQILLESQLGIDNAQAIAALEGVDILGVGLNDLAADLGCLGDTRNARVSAACRRVAAAAKVCGKVAVAGGVSDASHYRSLLEEGFAALIFAGIDTDVLAAGLKHQVELWDERTS